MVTLVRVFAKFFVLTATLAPIFTTQSQARSSHELSERLTAINNLYNESKTLYEETGPLLFWKNFAYLLSKDEQQHLIKSIRGLPELPTMTSQGETIFLQHPSYKNLKIDFRKLDKSILWINDEKLNLSKAQSFQEVLEEVDQFLNKKPTHSKINVFFLFLEHSLLTNSTHAIGLVAIAAIVGALVGVLFHNARGQKGHGISTDSGAGGTGLQAHSNAFPQGSSEAAGPQDRAPIPSGPKQQNTTPPPQSSSSQTQSCQALSQKHQSNEEGVVYDAQESKTCLEEMLKSDSVLKSRKIEDSLLSCLQIVRVPYKNSSGQINYGELIVNKDIAPNVLKTYQDLAQLSEKDFHIDKIENLSNFSWDDDKSMNANNTSAWNYRTRGSSSDKLSWHAVGRAIDFNPMQNPYERKSGNSPPNGKYDKTDPRSISKDGPVYKAFEKNFGENGFIWGGNWNPPDYQHFEFLPKAPPGEKEITSSSAPDMNKICQNPTSGQYPGPALGKSDQDLSEADKKRIREMDLKRGKKAFDYAQENSSTIESAPATMTICYPANRENLGILKYTKPDGTTASCLSKGQGEGGAASNSSGNTPVGRYLMAGFGGNSKGRWGGHGLQLVQTWKGTRNGQRGADQSNYDIFIHSRSDNGGINNEEDFNSRKSNGCPYVSLACSEQLRQDFQHVDFANGAYPVVDVIEGDCQAI